MTTHLANRVIEGLVPSRASETNLKLPWRSNPGYLAAERLSATTRGLQIVLMILAFVDANLAEPSIDVCLIAGLAGITPRHVQRVVRAATGLSFGQFVRRRRVVKAAELLIADRMALRIKEVAARVGLIDTRTLDRYFVQELGITPSNYRAQYLRELLAVSVNGDGEDDLSLSWSRSVTASLRRRVAK